MTYNQPRWWSSIPREPGAQLGIYNSSSTATTFDTDPRALGFGHPLNLNQRHASLVTISDSPTACRPILFPQLLLYANAVFRTSIPNLGGVCPESSIPRIGPCFRLERQQRHDLLPSHHGELNERQQPSRGILPPPLRAPGRLPLSARAYQAALTLPPPPSFASS